MDLCGLFVVIFDSRVYLIHQTARLFLLRDFMATGGSSSDFGSSRWAFDIRDCHFLIAKICTQRLLLDDLEGLKNKQAMLAAPFSNYASFNWIRHLREASHELVLLQLVSKVLDKHPPDSQHS